MKSVRIICLLVAFVLVMGFHNTKNIYAAPHDISLAVVCTSVPQEPKEEEDEGEAFKRRIDAIVKKNRGIVDEVKKGNLYLPKNTDITLILNEPLNSRKIKKGANFRLKAAENLIINDVIVIPKGQEVIGKVLDAHGNGLFGAAGKLEINIPFVETINQVKVPVNGYVNGYGNTDGGAIAVAAVVSLVGGLFMKGTNIEYLPGQLFTVTVAKDTDLLATPKNLKEVMNPNRVKGKRIKVNVAQ